MAILNSGNNGNIRGRVGDSVYRQEKGKTIISAYTRFIKTTSVEAKKNRNNFGICNSICCIMLHSEVLKGVWNDYPGKGKMHLNKAISFNRPHLKSIEDLDNIVLVPADTYFNAELLNVSSTSQVLTITVASVASKTWMNKWRISAQGLLYWKNITPEGLTEQLLVSTGSDTKVILPDEPMSFDLTILESDKYPLFPDKKFVVNLIIYDMSGKPVEASVNLKGTF